MSLPHDIRYSDQLLREAMQMLSKMHHRLGMFERQHYTELKRRFDHHDAIQSKLRDSLNAIETSDNDD